MRNMLISFCFFLLVVGCQRNQFPFPTSHIIINGKAISIEIASTYEARGTGLMNRKELAADSGMLFIYQSEQYLRFWMKDTLIPLSIAFIKADGTIHEIKPMYPLNEEPVWSVDAVKYALEVNQDWFEKNNIKAGDKVFLPDDIKNIKAESD